jgi:hypothetical protein
MNLNEIAAQIEGLDSLDEAEQIAAIEAIIKSLEELVS